MRLHIEVVVWRGSIAESRHSVQAVACDRDAARVLETPDADVVTTFRSAAKPLQLLPLVERGHADRWGFDEAQLAVMAASHTGSADHVRNVRGILERIGVDESKLACGFHEPLDPEERARLRERPGEPSRVYNNCSGKHAGMLCLAKSEGWPLEGYERAEHPLQILMRKTVAEACGLLPEALQVAVDGCSVSVFGLPLAAMARGYASLGAASADGSPRERAMARIRAAMMTHPVQVGGAGRLSTALMESGAGRRLAKGGAEGLECLALTERRLGVAVKCEDGEARAVGPAVAAVLEHLEEWTAADRERLREWAEPRVTNYAGIDCGRLEARVRVLAPAAA